MSRGNDIGVDRRKMMQMLGAGGGTAFIAGCSTGEDTPTPTSGGEDPDTDTPTPTATPTPEPLQHGGTFIDATTGSASAVNALLLSDGSTQDRVFQVFDGGYNRNSPEYADISPRWFSEYDIADSLDTVTIKLQENLEYGNPYGDLNAETYMWNIENLFNADWYSYAYKSEFTYGTERKPYQFEKTGTYEITVSVDQPRPFFPYNIPLGYTIPVPRDIVEPYMEEEDAEGLEQDERINLSDYSGNLGPWKLADYKSQSVYSYERNDDYYLRELVEDDDRIDDVYAEAPYFDNYKVQYFQDDGTARQALKAGEVDRVAIPSSKLNNFKGEDGLEIFTNPYIAYTDWMGINHRANGWSQLKNKKVRQALAHLYDNDAVVENILGGKGTTQDTLHPQWGPYYPSDDNLWKDDGSMETAKTLLEEGTSSDFGYSGDTFVDGNGDQVELTIVYVSGTTDDLRVEYTKKRLEDAGFSINVESTSWTNLLYTYFAANKPADGVDAEEMGYGEDNFNPAGPFNKGPADEAVSSKSWDLMHTLGGGYGPLTPAGTVIAFLGERGFLNAFGYSAESGDLAALRDEANTAESIEAARSTVAEMFKIVSEERPVIFESNYFDYDGYNSRVVGKPKSPAASYFTDIDKDVMAFEDGESGR
jgi:peptide/nickel transport system substrate-binding protein